MRVAAAAATALTPAWASAQLTSAPNQNRQLPSREQVQQPAPPPATTANVRVESRDAVPTPPCPLSDSPLKVTLTSVRFAAVGRESVPPEIARVLAGIGPEGVGEQPIASICTIRDKANAALAAAGYVASVQVPPQKIADGALALSVVLARIVEIRVHGEAGRYRSVLAGAIERLRKLDPLNERDAERLLLLTGDVPGLDVQLALRPAGGAPGDVIGDLNVATQRVSMLANVQNYGSKALGRETAYARVDFNGLLTADDTLYVGGSTTARLREQQVAQIGYRAGDPASGLTLGPRLTYAWSRPDIGTLDLRSRSIIGGFDITRPLVRTVRRNLSATIGFEAIEQQIRIYDQFGYSPLNLDRLRVAYTRIDGRMSERRFDGLDAYAISGGLELRKGLGIFDATRRGQVNKANYAPSRFEGDPKAFIVRGQFAALGRVNKTISFSHSLLGQWANRPLLNFDEQALGNLTIGFGYDPGANSADRFIGAHSEARLDFHVRSGVDLQLFGFGDNVYIVNLDAFATETKRHLRSVGGGVRARLPGPLLLEASYARPLDRALSIDKARAPARFLLSLTAQISPKFR